MIMFIFIVRRESNVYKTTSNHIFLCVETVHSETFSVIVPLRKKNKTIDGHLRMTNFTVCEYEK